MLVFLVYDRNESIFSFYRMLGCEFLKGVRVLISKILIRKIKEIYVLIDKVIKSLFFLLSSGDL